MMLRVETRRSVALFLSPMVLAAAWWMAWNGVYGSMQDAQYMNVYTWEETSRVIKDSILTTGPILAGLSAWVAGREARRGAEDLLSTTAKPQSSRLLATWAGTVIPFVAAYVLLALLLGIPTAINATWGVPLPGYTLVGLVALLMDSTLGFAVGHYLRNWFAAPLVAVALYVLHIMPMGFYDFGINYTLLSPAAYSNLYGSDVFHEPPQLAVPQLLFFGGLGGAALSAVLFRGVEGKARITSLASLVVCAGGLILALNTDHPDSMSAGEPDTVPYEPVCKEDEITVCVHPAYEKLLPETVRAVNQVAEPLIGIPATPERAVQIDNFVTPEDFEKGTATFGYPGEEAKYDIAESLVVDEAKMEELFSIENKREASEEDLKKCGGSPDQRYFEPSYEAQSVIAGWLLQRDGAALGEVYMGGCPNAQDLVDRFAALESIERETWLENNLADLRAGKATLKDLP
jgi:hypothetical protein